MILGKTPAGQQAFKDRSVPLTPRQRSAFILCDGKRSVDQVLDAGAGIEREDIDQMLELGLLGHVGVTSDAENGDTQASSPAPSTEGATSASARSAQQRYQDAYPIAARLTASLGLRGFRLNLAVEGARSYEDLLALAPRIRMALGPHKSEPLDRALMA